MPQTRPEFGDRRKLTIPASIPRVRMRRGNLVAEIIRDRRAPKLVFCVVQERGSREILFLGQFFSRQEAVLAAEELFSAHARRSAA